MYIHTHADRQTKIGCFFSTRHLLVRDRMKKTSRAPSSLCYCPQPRRRQQQLRLQKKNLGEEADKMNKEMYGMAVADSTLMHLSCRRKDLKHTVRWRRTNSAAWKTDLVEIRRQTIDWDRRHDTRSQPSDHCSPVAWRLKIQNRISLDTFSSIVSPNTPHMKSWDVVNPQCSCNECNRLMRTFLRNG